MMKAKTDAAELFDGAEFDEVLPDRKLSLEPLLIRWEHDLARLSRACGVTIRTVERWAKDGLSFTRADEVASALNYPPAFLWGPDWWGDIDVVDDLDGPIG